MPSPLLTRTLDPRVQALMDTGKVTVTDATVKNVGDGNVATRVNCVIDPVDARELFPELTTATLAELRDPDAYAPVSLPLSFMNARDDNDTFVWPGATLDDMRVYRAGRSWRDEYFVVTTATFTQADKQAHCTVTGERI